MNELRFGVGCRAEMRELFSDSNFFPSFPSEYDLARVIRRRVESGHQLILLTILLSLTMSIERSGPRIWNE